MEKEKGAGGGRRTSGIHFEIASHPVRSPFFAASSSRIPTPSRGLFPAPSLRKSHSPCPSRPPPLPPSLTLCLSFSLSVPYSIWLSPFREATCSPRILISSKVLFPLNQAATRNNALYVRVLRLSFLPLSSLFAFSSPFWPRYSRGSQQRCLPHPVPRSSRFVLSSFRHASELAICSNFFRRGPLYF